MYRLIRCPFYFGIVAWLMLPFWCAASPVASHSPSHSHHKKSIHKVHSTKKHHTEPAAKKSKHSRHQVLRHTHSIKHHPISAEEYQRSCTVDTGIVIKRSGTAVWYAPGFYHKKTASGERLDSVSYTAAHLKLPFNTMVRVINLDNNDTVIVRINDRGPFRSRHCIDLSRAAAKKIGLHKTHTARVRLERVIKDTL